MKTLIRNIFIFLFGVFVGATAITFHYYFEIAPPMPQETSRINVSVGKLKDKDQWLEGARFQVVPLDGVESRRQYAVLIVTPPLGGIHTQGATSWLDLAASNLIQPIQIGAQDFGPNGDQVVIKFIDEGVVFSQFYNSSQHLSIGSPDNSP